MHPRQCGIGLHDGAVHGDRLLVHPRRLPQVAVLVVDVPEGEVRPRVVGHLGDGRLQGGNGLVRLAQAQMAQADHVVGLGPVSVVLGPVVPGPLHQRIDPGRRGCALSQGPQLAVEDGLEQIDPVVVRLVAQRRLEMPNGLPEAPLPPGFQPSIEVEARQLDGVAVAQGSPQRIDPGPWRRVGLEQRLPQRIDERPGLAHGLLQTVPQGGFESGRRSRGCPRAWWARLRA